jgi:isoleucyl-tRNA synthetase
LLAVNKDMEYAVVELVSKGKVELIIVAAEKVTEIEKLVARDEGTEVRVVRVLPGSELVGREYMPIFPYFAETAKAFRVVEADFVNIDEGTGIVHIAPAYGEDDFELGKREGLEVTHHVDMAGKFKPEVTDFAGMDAKGKDEVSTDVAIIKYLAARDLLLAKQKVRHSYPHCWRCDQPLLNYATASFFVKVTASKDELVANNQKINWLPAHFKDGRFGKWLEGARDWAISRNRFWGTPLPLWQSEDGDFICVGSRAELEQLSGQN